MAKEPNNSESAVTAGKKSSPKKAQESRKFAEVRELFAARIRSLRPPKPAKITHCLNCGVKIPSRKQKFCSEKCAKHVEYLKRKAHYLKKTTKWRKDNIERVRANERVRSRLEVNRAKKRGWRAKNRARTKKYRAEWWERHGEQVRAQQREKWSKMDPKHKRALQKKYEKNAHRRLMEQEMIFLLSSLSQPQEK